MHKMRIKGNQGSSLSLLVIVFIVNKSFLSVKIAVSLLLIGYLTNTSIFADDYEITFPILLDAQNIPYNQLPQQGQTII